MLYVPRHPLLALILALFAWMASGTGPQHTEARAAETENAAKARERLDAAAAAADQHDSRKAVDEATRALELDSKLAAAFYLRGRENFRLGLFAESVADFDRYVELVPQHASRQWERGISCYYAGKFAQGAKQFELYQTYHNADVENAVWRFLCIARDRGGKPGMDEARRSLLEIERDARVPMMEIYALYQGKAAPEEVLAACRAGEPNEQLLLARQFYAHLYLGLYFEAAGESERAAKHIGEAADKKYAELPRVNRYMWDVARVHATQQQDASAPETRRE